LSADRSFDLEAALATLFAEGAIVASDIAPESDRVPL
jgi:hypothetical protein